MPAFRYSLASVSFVALFAAGTASADVTADDVWGSMQSWLTMYGEDGVTIGGESRNGPALTVSDIAFNISSPDTDINSTIPSITFTENGDGTVSVTMPAEMLMYITDPSSPDNAATVGLRNTGLVMTVSGTPEALVYDYSADSYTLSLDELTDDGEMVPVEASLKAQNIAAHVTMSSGDLRRFEAEGTIGAIDFLVDGNDTENEIDLNFSGKFQNIAFTEDGAIPMDYDAAHPELALANGLAINAGITLGQMAMLLNVNDGGDVTAGTISAASGGFDFGISGDALHVAESATELAVQLQSPEVPMPIDFTLGEFGLNLTMPLGKTDEPVPVAAGLSLVDLAVNEQIWMMADPAGALPHDPLTAVVSVTGMGKLFYDLTNPADQMAMEQMDGPPGEIYSLNLDALHISAAGAEVKGSGAFTFDNSDLTTIPGMPRPTGEANFEVNGANGLLDKLVGMGLVPEDQVMGFRMMMGMFATVVGDDMLTSKIEVTPDGGILANGQRLN